MSPLRDLVNVGHHERQGTPRYTVVVHSQQMEYLPISKCAAKGLHHIEGKFGLDKAAIPPRSNQSDRRFHHIPRNRLTDHMVKPASAETLYFTSQICRRHHQIRKEISCHGIVEKIHENPWRKWEVSCHLPSADAPAYP